MLLFAACATQPPRQLSAPQHVTVFIAADLRGYLEPCGCSQAMRGGIGRAALQIEEARKTGPTVFFEGGNTLFRAPKLSEAEQPQERTKAETLAQALKTMGLAARVPGPDDDALGAELRKSLALPDVALGQARLVEAAGHHLALVAATPQGIASQVAQARSRGAELVVAMIDLPLDKAEAAAESSGADLVVATGDRGEFSAEENRLIRTGTPVARLQSKGRSLLRLDVTFAGNGKLTLGRGQADIDRELASLDQRIALMAKQLNAPGLRDDTRELYKAKLAELADRRAKLAATPPPVERGNTFYARFIPLESTLPEAPAVRALVNTYDTRVGELNLEWARAHGKDCPAPAKGEAGFVGSASCRECHADAFAFWQSTKHAHAYATLQQANKQLNLECVRCHVTGYQQPGGMCRIDRTAGREDVGCEDCHGPGSIHGADPTAKNILARPEQSACVGCHNPENSPHFDYATYLPRILGRGHGQKP